MSPERVGLAWQRPLSAGQSRPWFGAWPGYLPHSLDYPIVPAWWLLERNLERYPDRVAVRHLDHETAAEVTSLTYAALASRARALAASMQRLGVDRGARVAVCLPNSPELIVSFYGAWLAGATVVSLNPTVKASEQIGRAHV